MLYCAACADLIAKRVPTSTIAMPSEFDIRGDCDYCKAPNVMCAGRRQEVIRIVGIRKRARAKE